MLRLLSVIFTILIISAHINSQTIKFSPQTNIYFTGSIGTVAAGDLNNNGKIDLVTAGFDYSSSMILLSTSLNNTLANSSTIAFSASTTLSPDFKPKTVRLEDINNDGKSDIIVSDTDSSLFVYLNSTLSGASVLSFEDKVEFNMGITISDFKIADINSDGKMDLISANYDDKSISILLNTTPPNSTIPIFVPRFNISLTHRPWALEISDINNDGLSDLIISSTDSLLSIYLNQTPVNNLVPVFSSKTDFVLPDAVYSIVANDLNGDSKNDLILTNSNLDNISVFQNNTEEGSFLPVFGESINFTTGNNPRLAALKDFDRDGKLDVAVANIGEHNISILKNTSVYGTGSITLDNKIDALVNKSQTYLISADFNNDGRDDIAVVFELSNYIGVLLNETPLNFKNRTDYQSAFGPSAMDKADFNNDGNFDLVTGNFGDFSILLGNGDGTLQTHYEISLNQFSPNFSVVAADFNADNNFDIAITNANGNDFVSVFLGDGTGQFSTENTFATENGLMGMSKGDFNNDGIIDLVTANANVNSMSVLIGVGDGTFAAAVNYATATAPVYSNVNDFNSDGNQDIAIVNQNSNSISLFLGNGDGTFSTKSDFEVGNTPVMLVSSDFNNDSLADLAVVNSSDSGISILLSNGDGTFQAKADYHTGPAPLFSDTGDFNKDGFIDIAVPNQNKAVSILYNQGNGTFSPFVDYSVGSGPFQVVSVDLNNDGDLDIATANSATDSVSILINNLNFITSVENENIIIPNKITLSQNYPNPFNPTTTIKYSLPFLHAGIAEVESRHALSVQLKIYDILGREVATLVNEKQTPGNYQVQFDVAKLTSGVYIYRLQAGSFNQSKKMILLK